MSGHGGDGPPSRCPLARGSLCPSSLGWPERAALSPESRNLISRYDRDDRRCPDRTSQAPSGTSFTSRLPKAGYPMVPAGARTPSFSSLSGRSGPHVVRSGRRKRYARAARCAWRACRTPWTPGSTASGEELPMMNATRCGKRSDGMPRARRTFGPLAPARPRTSHRQVRHHPDRRHDRRRLPHQPGSDDRHARARHTSSIGP